MGKQLLLINQRRQDSLDIIDHHMVTPFNQRPSPGSLLETLTGPWGKTRMALTTNLKRIEDVVNQQMATSQQTAEDQAKLVVFARLYPSESLDQMQQIGCSQGLRPIRTPN